jgi:hypothetical protein
MTYGEYTVTIQKLDNKAFDCINVLIRFPEYPTSHIIHTSGR